MHAYEDDFYPSHDLVSGNLIYYWFLPIYEVPFKPFSYHQGYFHSGFQLIIFSNQVSFVKISTTLFSTSMGGVTDSGLINSFYNVTKMSDIYYITDHKT